MPFRIQLIPTSISEEAEMIDAEDDSSTSTDSASSGLPPGPTKWERLELWRDTEATCACECESGADKHSSDCSVPFVEVPDILCR